MTTPGAAVTVLGVLMYAHTILDVLRDGEDVELVMMRWPLWKILWHRAGVLTALLFINVGVMM